ncbi:MAG: S9 family peptidase [Parachlamydiales bacterium]|nr:S9 family peptidase [Parachlamydiales bacterium]
MILDAPYGEWVSPLTAELMVSKNIQLQEMAVADDGIYWIEGRPTEKGRAALVFCHKSGLKEDLQPAISLRSRVHEYGGGAMAFAKGLLVYCNDSDRYVYVWDKSKSPVALTNDSNSRYADFAISGSFVIAVCEKHTPGQSPDNMLVSIPIDGSMKISVIHKGHDFYSSPRLSNDGKKIAFIAWDFPNMPWDGSYLYTADVDKDGTLSNAKKVAGKLDESVCQPLFSMDGTLYFMSDRTGWWNLYSVKNGNIESVCPMNKECALPPWVFKMSNYAFVSYKGQDSILLTYCEKGQDKLGVVNLTTKELITLPLDYNLIRNLVAKDKKAYFFGATSKSPSELVELDIDSGSTVVITKSSDLFLEESLFSLAKPIMYKSSKGQDVYGFFYPPHNPSFKCTNEKPPLIVRCHGGPTAHNHAALSLDVQYWTTRGFAVVDVNYSGSTGYGREYRNRLNGNWGVSDVEDCLTIAKGLSNDGLIDESRVVIRGGSAGGFTVLAALTQSSFFAGGTSYYGVADLELLAKDTHKFESRYLDQLIAPYPKEADLYKKRSPLTNVASITSPLLILQGSDDPVVPLNQSQSIYDALLEKGNDVAMIVFKGEMHGFRDSKNIKQALESELSFYGQILNIKLSEKLPAVELKQPQTR